MFWLGPLGAPAPKVLGPGSKTHLKSTFCAILNKKGGDVRCYTQCASACCTGSKRWAGSPYHARVTTSSLSSRRNFASPSLSICERCPGCEGAVSPAALIEDGVMFFQNESAAFNPSFKSADRLAALEIFLIFFEIGHSDLVDLVDLVPAPALAPLSFSFSFSFIFARHCSLSLASDALDADLDMAVCILHGHGTQGCTTRSGAIVQ